MICPCGQQIESSSAYPYSSWTMNDKGEIIFAICVHGHIVIDKNQEEESNE
jgi:hypothetical protein